MTLSNRQRIILTLIAIVGLVFIGVYEVLGGWIDAGGFIVTAYCSCRRCCGPLAAGVTRSGTVAEPWQTVAVDEHVIPLGSRLRIDGFEYVAEDTGGKIRGKRIDIFFQTHDEARRFGRQTWRLEIWRP